MSTSLPTEEPKTTKQKILEAGASLLQSKDPIKAFKQHLMSISAVAGDPSQQFILHHFVNAFNEDFAQALLYDGDLADSKLVGIQYIVSDKVFRTLPEDERKLWSPLQYMVRNGLLVAPSLPAMAEKPLMTRLLSSYSKTFLFWQTGHNPLPLGIPKILSPIATDGQVNKQLSTSLLEAAKIELADLIKRREGLEPTSALPSVSPLQEAYQLFLQRVGGPQNQELSGELGSNYPSDYQRNYQSDYQRNYQSDNQSGYQRGISETYGDNETSRLTITHPSGAPLAAAGLAGATGAYGASRLTDTDQTRTSGLTGRSYEDSTPVTGGTRSTTPMTGSSGYSHTTTPQTGSGSSGYSHTTPLTGDTYSTTTPLTGTGGYSQSTTPLTGPSGYSHTTTPLTGTSGYPHSTTPLTGTGGTYNTTYPSSTTTTPLTGTGATKPISHQAAVDNVAAGLLGGEHGHAPNRDVTANKTIPGATSSAAYPYHTTPTTDYTAQ